jgi:hypothetical protein
MLELVMLINNISTAHLLQLRTQGIVSLLNKFLEALLMCPAIIDGE